MKVSCVMPTRDRHRFIPGAVECFLSQTYTDAELVILDDGESACIKQVPVHPRVRYVYQNPTDQPRPTTGVKRNYTNRLAFGDVIIHWDDDDWSAPGRIEHQLNFMFETKCAVTGYHTLLYWREADKKGFYYSDPAFRPHAAGSSLCYIRSWWEKHPFPDYNVGEDFAFCVMAYRHRAIASQDANGMLVARAHGSNTCTPRFGEMKFGAVTRESFPAGFLKTL